MKLKYFAIIGVTSLSVILFFTVYYIPFVVDVGA